MTETIIYCPFTLVIQIHDLFVAGAYLFNRNIMIDDIDDTCKIFAHICFHIVRSGKKLRNTVVQVCGDNLYRSSLFRNIQSNLASPSVNSPLCSADKHALCVTLFDLLCHIQHTLSGGDHIVDNNNVLAFYRIAKELVCHDRFFPFTIVE